MRMIDADALMREFAEFVRASNNSDFADAPTWNDAVSLVGSAPTIEAEPTYEQLEEYCRKRCLVIVNGALFNEMKSRWSVELVKHRHWVEDEYGISHCSECGTINNTVYKNFCPNCGATMDEVEE